MNWELRLSPQALKDAKILERSKYFGKAKELLSVIKRNPFQNPPPYEKLKPLWGKKYSRRINSQHRLVYEVYENDRLIRVLSMWTHYE